MRIVYSVGLMLLLCVITGCDEPKERVRLGNCVKLKGDDPQIIEFANKWAKALGHDLSIYEPPKITENSEEWGIVYKFKATADGRVPVGHLLLITINRTTCECKAHIGS